MRKIVCDNISCDNERPIDRYGQLNEDETPWIKVEQDKVHKYNEETEEDEVVHEGIDLEFCSVMCTIDQLNRV